MTTDPRVEELRLEAEIIDDPATHSMWANECASLARRLVEKGYRRIDTTTHLIVPREPTEAILRGLFENDEIRKQHTIGNKFGESDEYWYGRMYRAMLSTYESSQTNKPLSQE